MHVGHDVVAVDDEGRVGRHAQRDVEHGAVLGDVDPLAGEHGVAPGLDAGGLGDGQEVGEDGGVDALLRQVDAQVAGGVDEVLGSFGVLGEQLRERGWLAAIDEAGPGRGRRHVEGGGGLIGHRRRR